MRSGVLLIFGLTLIGLAQEIQPNQDSRRFALVIGNGKYASLPPLLSAQKEADLMAQTLRDARFDVTVIRDFRMPDFLVNGVRPFLNKLRPNDVALIYYSGYAIQIVDDDNYLLPVNFEPNSPKNMQDRAY